MADKYLDLSGLTTYDGKIKAHIDSIASNKADATHSHTVSDVDDLTVTATELNHLDGVTSNVQTQLSSKVSKFGSTMTGNLEICNNMEQSPMLTISGTANESGVRASSYIIKAANSMSNGGTEIVDEGFDTTSTSLVVNNNAGLSGSLKLKKMNSDYSIANYSIYGEHNKPTPDDIGAAPTSHEHSASKITSGILAVEQGGTGNMWGYVRAGAQEGSTIGSLATAEGRETIASGYCSHAEGNYCEATGTGSHAEGQNTEASGTAAHSEGEGTEAGGNFSHAEGEKTVASGKWQHVQGKYNIEDTTDTYAHIVGNGESNSARSNAHTLDWDGNAWFAGDVTVTDGSGNSISVLSLINRINELETMMGQVNTLLDEINGEVV